MHQVAILVVMVSKINNINLVYVVDEGRAMEAWGDVTRKIPFQEILSVFRKHYLLFTSVTAFGMLRRNCKGVNR